MSVKFSADTTVDPAQETSSSARTKPQETKPEAALRSALKTPASAPNKVGADGRFKLPAPPSADGEAQRQARAAASTAEAVEAEIAAAKATKEAMEEAFDKDILKKANSAARARQISSDAEDNNVDDHDADDGDCADEVDDVSSDDHDADGVDSTDGKDSSDADDSSVDDHDADDSAALGKAQHDALENYVRKQAQDKLDSDARIANNAPSAADRILLEQQNTRRRAEYAQAVRERTERLELEEMDSYYGHGGSADYDETFSASDSFNRVYVEASDSFIREQEELHARAKQKCSARAANGEDARDVRARWEAFERYGCCGALEETFFDPRNG
jgi:hypothetical protein